MRMNIEVQYYIAFNCNWPKEEKSLKTVIRKTNYKDRTVKHFIATMMQRLRGMF
jgi:hypothetical protein